MRGLAKVCFFLMLVIWGVNARASDDKDVSALFADAVKAYHAAQYDQAVALNEQILAKGVSSPALQYNLGNAYLKSGRLGRAMVHYLRAMRSTPRDSDLRANLSFARTLVENYTAWPRSTVFVPAQRFWSEGELPWVSFMAFALTGAFFLWGLFAGFPRKRVFLGAVFLGAVTVYFFGALGFQTIDRRGQSVCVEKVEARFEPTLQATVYFKVPEGTELKVLREKEDWYKVQRSDGKTGWVPAVFVERI